MEKKTYHAPELREHGTLTETTKDSGGTNGYAWGESDALGDEWINCWES